MKKYNKRFEAKHMTVEAMASCYVDCYTACKDCGVYCAGNFTNGAALVGIQNLGSKLDDVLASVGSVV